MRGDHGLRLLILSYLIYLHNYICWRLTPHLRACARLDGVVYFNIQLSRVRFALPAVERSCHNSSYYSTVSIDIYIFQRRLCSTFSDRDGLAQQENRMLPMCGRTARSSAETYDPLPAF